MTGTSLTAKNSNETVSEFKRLIEVLKDAQSDALEAMSWGVFSGRAERLGKMRTRIEGLEKQMGILKQELAASLVDTELAYIIKRRSIPDLDSVKKLPEYLLMVAEARAKVDAYIAQCEAFVDGEYPPGLVIQSNINRKAGDGTDCIDPADVKRTSDIVREILNCKWDIDDARLRLEMVGKIVESPFFVGETQMGLLRDMGEVRTSFDLPKLDGIALGIGVTSSKLPKCCEELEKAKKELGRLRIEAAGVESRNRAKHFAHEIERAEAKVKSLTDRKDQMQKQLGRELNELGGAMRTIRKEALAEAGKIEAIILRQCEFCQKSEMELKTGQPV